MVKIMEQKMKIGNLVLSWERANNEDLGWSFSVENENGEDLIGNLYKDEFDIDDLIECLNQVKNLSEV